MEDYLTLGHSLFVSAAYRGAQERSERLESLFSSLVIDKCTNWQEETQIGRKGAAVPRETAGLILTSNDMATGSFLKAEAILGKKRDCRISFDSDMHNAFL